MTGAQDEARDIDALPFVALAGGDPKLRSGWLQPNFCYRYHVAVRRAVSAFELARLVILHDISLF
jgi:hypothetical protein